MPYSSLTRDDCESSHQLLTVMTLSSVQNKTKHRQTATASLLRMSQGLAHEKQPCSVSDKPADTKEDLHKSENSDKSQSRVTSWFEYSGFTEICPSALPSPLIKWKKIKETINPLDFMNFL